MKRIRLRARVKRIPLIEMINERNDEMRKIWSEGENRQCFVIRDIMNKDFCIYAMRYEGRYFIVIRYDGKLKKYYEI